jgi:Zn-dependent peptidase ImmA (M78 family)/transcriptional regulator with XRE-family HTH domain
MHYRVNPQMIVVARESQGISQWELAGRASIRQPTLSRYESGLLEVPEADLKRLVRALDFPPAFFEQTDRVYGFGGACFYHRKRRRIAIGELRRIQAKLNVFRFQLQRLLRGVEVKTDCSLIQLPPEDCGGPAGVAQAIRRLWNLPLGPVDSVISTVEHAGAIVYSWDFGTSNLDAISQVAPDSPPIIFTNSRIPADRLRFTLMHEIGHLVMHESYSPTMEQEADEFASEFLMPASEIRSELRKLSMPRLAALKERWKVSMQALIRRARDVGQITDRQYRSFCTRMSMLGWRVDEPVDIPSEQPTVFENILRAYTDEQQLSISEISAIANANDSRFRMHWRERPDRLKVVSD